ncbi:hypothetical protein MPLDJ20_110480 [Mesorhizobium plurifarium]|uniref:Uncharacterized protein n=1 Tax=Mesorhizobium plurifarium TaxID=69974 RepID=A0A090E6F9_MESPL|nr:hypothetical protein MPLDJ20_110480 [Mesorhizobium plurifarium]
MAVASRAPDGLGPEHHRRVKHGIVSGERFPQRVVAGRHADRPQQLSVPVDLQSRRAEQLQIGIRFETRHLQAQPVGQRDIVAIHARHKRGPRECNPHVQRIDDALAAAGDNSDPAITVADRRRDRGAVIARSIVDDDDFDIRQILVQDALQGLADILRTVFHRNDHAYCRQWNGPCDDRPDRTAVELLDIGSLVSEFQFQSSDICRLSISLSGRSERDLEGRGEQPKDRFALFRLQRQVAVEADFMKPASPPFAIGLPELNPRQGGECGYRPLRHRVRVHMPIEHLPIGSAGVEAGEPVESEIERLAADGVEAKETIAGPQKPSRAGPAQVAVKSRGFKRFEGVAWLRREKVLVEESECGRRGRLEHIVPHPIERRAVRPARVFHSPRIGRQPDIGGAMVRANPPVLVRGSIADTVVGDDMEIVADKSFRQPQLQVQAPRIVEGNSKQDMAAAGGIADGRDIVTLDRLVHEPLVDSPVTGSLDGVQQRLQPQPLPPVIFAQGLWHVWRLSVEPGLAIAIDRGNLHERTLQLTFGKSSKATASESLDNRLYTAYSCFQHDQHLSARCVCLNGEVWGAPGVSLRQSWGVGRRSGKCDENLLCNLCPVYERGSAEGLSEYQRPTDRARS